MTARMGGVKGPVLFPIRFRWDQKGPEGGLQANHFDLIMYSSSKACTWQQSVPIRRTRAAYFLHIKNNMYFQS